MHVTLWIVQSLLAAAFLGAGVLKLVRTRRQLAGSGMGWAEDFSDGAVKGIGAVEVLGALGLVLPAALGVATVLTPLAAAGLFLVMAGAVVTHLRRAEASQSIPAAVLGVLALAVAILRFGPYAV